MVVESAAKTHEKSKPKIKVKVSKNGKGIYRKIFYLPTVYATVHNQKIRVFYQRLLAHHKIKKLAVIASMRKILLIAHTMYRGQTEYFTT